MNAKQEYPYIVWRQIRMEYMSDADYQQYQEDRRRGNDGIWEARWQDEYRRGEPPEGCVL
jgi:endonuclease YncB( thermonuclease family)